MDKRLPGERDFQDDKKSRGAPPWWPTFGRTADRTSKPSTPSADQSVSSKASDNGHNLSRVENLNATNGSGDKHSPPQKVTNQEAGSEQGENGSFSFGKPSNKVGDEESIGKLWPKNGEIAAPSDNSQGARQGEGAVSSAESPGTPDASRNGHTSTSPEIVQENKDVGNKQKDANGPLNEKSDAGRTPTSDWCRSISDMLKEMLNSGKSIETKELAEQIKNIIPFLGLKEHFLDKIVEYPKEVRLYVPKDVPENGDILVTNKKQDDNWILVNDAQQNPEWRQKIGNSQGQVKLDLKMYVIQRPDQNNKQNNSSEQEGPDILVTHDSNLVKEKINGGWEALPGTVTGIEISNDESKIERWQKIEQAYNRIIGKNDKTSELLKICEKALSNIYWDAYDKKEGEREILNKSYYQKFQERLIREEVGSDKNKSEEAVKNKSEEAVKNYRESLLEKFKIYDESLKVKLSNDFNKLQSFVGENGSSTSERSEGVASYAEVTNDPGVVGDQGLQSSIPPDTDPSKRRDVTPPVSSSGDQHWIAKKTVGEALEWLASAKIAEALKERGLFKYLGYGTTDTRIETKGLRLYENNGTYYVTSGDKNFLNKYGLEDKHIVEKVNPEKFEELCNNFDKIQWDLPSMHAIRTVEREEEWDGHNKVDTSNNTLVGDPKRLRPNVLITDSEKVVQEKIAESKEKAWKAAVAWSLPAFDISSRRPTKEDRLIYKALLGEISERTKGKEIYKKNKTLLSAIDENVKDGNQTYRNIIKEYEKKFIELYYNSDSDTKGKLEKEFSDYSGRILAIKNKFKEGIDKNALKEEIVNYLNNVFKEIDGIRKQQESQSSGDGEGSSKTGRRDFASTSGQGDKGSKVVPDPGADNMSQAEHEERSEQSKQPDGDGNGTSGIEEGVKGMHGEGDKNKERHIKDSEIDVFYSALKGGIDQTIKNWLEKICPEMDASVREEFANTIIDNLKMNKHINENNKIISNDSKQIVGCINNTIDTTWDEYVRRDEHAKRATKGGSGDLKNSKKSEQVKGPETKNTSSTTDGGEKVGTEPVKDNRSDASQTSPEEQGAGDRKKAPETPKKKVVNGARELSSQELPNSDGKPEGSGQAHESEEEAYKGTDEPEGKLDKLGEGENVIGNQLRDKLKEQRKILQELQLGQKDEDQVLSILKEIHNEKEKLEKFLKNPEMVEKIHQDVEGWHQQQLQKDTRKTAELEKELNERFNSHYVPATGNNCLIYALVKAAGEEIGDQDSPTRSNLNKRIEQVRNFLDDAKIVKKGEKLDPGDLSGYAAICCIKQLGIFEKNPTSITVYKREADRRLWKISLLPDEGGDNPVYLYLDGEAEHYWALRPKPADGQ